MRTSKFIAIIIAVLNLQFLGMFFYKPALARDVADTNFCNRIEGATNENITMLNKNRASGKRHAMHITDNDTNLGQSRVDFDKKRSHQFDIMLQAYNNPQQKEAINQYRATIQAAIELRRTTIDTARAEFRSKLSDLSSLHRQQIDEAEAGLVSMVQAAFEGAKQGCKDGKSSLEVKQNFIGAMAQAKSEFLQAKAEFKDDSELQGLIILRDQKIQAAFDDFTKTLGDAKQKLLAVLEKN